MDEQGLIKLLGIVAVVSVILGFCAAKFVDYYLGREMGKLKEDFQRAAEESWIRYERLHSERAETIKELYAKLIQIDETLDAALNSFKPGGEPPLSEKVEQLSGQFNDLRAYFLPRRIFFDEQTSQLIDQILEVAKGIFYGVSNMPFYLGHPDQNYDREILVESHIFWDKARYAHHNDFALLKASLENQFRQLIGIRRLNQ